MENYTLLGLLSVGFIFWQLVKKVGQSLPIMDLAFLIAGLQWIVGPYLDYNTTSTHYKYYMYVSEYEYMSTIIPMFLLMIAPYYLLFRNNKFSNLSTDTYALNKIAIITIVIGFISNVLSKFLPSSLSFMFYLLGNLIYVGAGIILFQNNKKLKPLAYLISLWLLYYSIKNGVFHNLLIWGSFFFFIWATGKNIKWYFTIGVFCSSFFLASIIQSIKSDFRTQLAITNSPIELFTNLTIKAFNQGIGRTDEDINDLNVRLNQGWIISAIIENVPKNEPFAEGETITSAIYSSVIPRFLNPSKTRAGGRENFTRFTGLSIRQDTSMGTSIIGEAYANYGPKGGLLFMLLWGMFLAIFWQFLLSQQKKIFYLLFFIPLIFLQIIKAESELVVVLNHLTKSSIVTFAIIWVIQNYYLSKTSNINKTTDQGND